ncbi:hypothetical protein TL16_g00614 [Triparma laevis f. inornata]|uniref:Uncharacterized protein n=1 Tax=Triparma laevis f. inornata TaxID=1714386 RepID=A0A9W6ZG75_9STRA|nr:hypothetical protein TL16_g00614 [Triparma laevis f. inornata]
MRQPPSPESIGSLADLEAEYGDDDEYDPMTDSPGHSPVQVPNLDMKMDALAKRLEDQARVMSNIQEEAFDTKQALELKIHRLEERLINEKNGPPPSSSYSSKWRAVFVLGALLPSALALASLHPKLKGHNLLWIAASSQFEVFAHFSAWAAAFGNPANFSSTYEKVSIFLCSLLPAAFYFAKWYLTSSRFLFIGGCVFAAVYPAFILAGTRLYSKLAPHQLGLAVTAIFKSLSWLLGALLYVSLLSLRCILNVNINVEEEEEGGVELDELGHIKQCGNVVKLTYYISIFLLMSWIMIVVVPPMLGKKGLTWSSAMHLDMGRVEGLQFTLFCIISMQAIVMYALTDVMGVTDDKGDGEGEETYEYMELFMEIVDYSVSALFGIIALEYLFKAIRCCKRRNPSSSSKPMAMNADTFDYNPNSSML